MSFEILPGQRLTQPLLGIDVSGTERLDKLAKEEFAQRRQAVLDSARNRREALIKSTNDPEQFMNLLGEVTDAQVSLNALEKQFKDLTEQAAKEGLSDATRKAALETLQQQIKEARDGLEKQRRELDDDIRHAKELQKHTIDEDSPEGIKKGLEEWQRRMKSARTPEEKRRAMIEGMKRFFGKLGDGVIATGFFGFIGGIGHALKWRKLENWAERHKAPRDVRNWMREALQGDMKKRVGRGDTDEDDIERLKTEYEAKKAPVNNQAPPFAKQHPTLESYVKARMRETSSRNLKLRYTIKDLLENPAMTAEEQDRLKKETAAKQAEAHKKKVALEAQQLKEKRERETKLQRRYAMALVNGFNQLFRAKGHNPWEIPANWTTEQICQKIVTDLEGKRPWCKAINLYLYRGNLHEYDTDRNFLWISVDDILIRGLTHLIRTNPRGAVEAITKADGDMNIMGNASICEAAKTSLHALATALQAETESIKVDWAIAQGPEQAKKTAEDAANQKQDKENIEQQQQKKKQAGDSQ